MNRIDYDKELEKLKELVELEDKKKFEEIRKDYVEEAIKEEQDELEKRNQVQKFINMMESQCSEEELSHSDTYLYSIQHIKTLGQTIKNKVSKELNSNGFNLEEKGTNYLINLITMFYQERKLFNERLYSDYYRDFWDLSDENNVHYRLLGNNPEEVRLSIEESINNSYYNNDISKLVYTTADKFGYNKDNSDKISYMEVFKPSRRK